jgi:hypothetical protein
MSFTPFHSFRNEQPFVRLLERLHGAGKISDQVYYKFHRYHLSLMHKLKSGKHHLIQLKNKLTNVDIQEVADTSGNFLFETNLFIDGYFYNCGSALDILARELLVVFNESFPDNVYFHTAHNRIVVSRPNDSILSRLVDPTWKQEFSNYRNVLTHEVLLAASVSITIENRGPNQTHMIVLPLPDNPRADVRARTYTRNSDVLDYIEENFTRVLRLINGIYGEIYTRTRDGDCLPL